MTCRVIGLPMKKLSLQLRTHGDKGAADDDEHMDNLRLILAVFLAKYIDRPEYDMDADPELDYLTQILTAESMYQKGRAPVKDGSVMSIALNSYINYTRVTSEWAKQQYPDCTVQITVRLIQAVKDFDDIIAAHTLVVYF